MQGMPKEKCRERAGYLVLGLLGFLAMTAPSQAQPVFTLSNLNSTVSVNSGGSGVTGMTSWLVDGVNQAKGQWFYYRLGDVGGNLPINTIGNLSSSQLTANTLTLIYSDLPSSPDYQARVDYTLTGGAAGSGLASLGETVTFYNETANNLVLRLFDYADFDLAGQLGGQSVTTSQTQVGPAFKTKFTQTLGSFSVNSQTASGSIGNSGMEANLFSNTIQTITNGTPSGLNGVLSAGPGDVTAAAEWAVTLAAGQSLQLSKTFSLVVPEPSCAAVMSLGLAAWMLARRRGNIR